MHSFIHILFSLLAYMPADPLPADHSPADYSKTTLGVSQKGRTINAWYFPGTSNLNALVIGGMHGSELSSVEVANALIEQLKNEKPYYNVIVIPCLFPDNAETASRYSHAQAADPNRQMPSPGKAFDPAVPIDHIGRPIEPENQLLLKVIAQFRPHRIANIHAIRDITRAGIYADPRTDSKGLALGFATDSSLAVNMAMHIAGRGGYTPGNNLHQQPTALYYKDPPVAPAGQLQKRNTQGSLLPMQRGEGISLGSWASTAVDNAVNAEGNRDAMRLLTIEFPGYKAPSQYADSKQQLQCGRLVKLYASAINSIFLGKHFVENDL